MEPEDQGSGARRTDELTERTADDVAALAHRYTGVAKREVAAAGERAAWPAAVAAIGGLLADDSGDREAKLAFAKRMAEEAKHLLFIREAVVRAAEVEILGQEREMPSSMASVAAGTLKKPLALGAALGALLLGLGALAASALFIARPRLALRSRRMLRAA